MKLSRILFVSCLLGWVLGLTGVTGEYLTGFCLAMGSVLFSLACITRFITKTEAANY
jgi:hypothetical protein